MRILIVCPYALTRPGGVQQHVMEWASWLHRNGHSVAVAAPGAAETNGISMFDTGPFRMVRLPGTRFEVSFMDRTRRQAFRAFADAFEPDVVHHHAVWVPLVPLQVRRLLSRRPHLATFHDTPGGPAPVRLVLHTLMRVASFVLSFRFAGFITVSPEQRRHLSNGRFDAIPVVPNGLDTARLQPAAGALREAAQILFLGRLEPRKGVLTLLQAFRDVQRAQPGARLLIAGDGPQRPAAAAFIRHHGLSGVTLLGRVTEQEKLRLLHTATVLAAPSLYGESFGLVLVEAMAAGLPVCGFRNPGYAWLAGQYDESCFPAPGDSAGLAAVLIRLLASADARDALAGRGRAVAAAYDWNQTGPELLAQYAAIQP